MQQIGYWLSRGMNAANRILVLGRSDVLTFHHSRTSLGPNYAP